MSEWWDSLGRQLRRKLRQVINPTPAEVVADKYI